MADQLHILKNAIEKALNSQMYSPDRKHLVANYWYYSRSTWHSEECNWAGKWTVTHTPSTDIWWPRMVLWKVTLHILKNAIEKAVDSQTYPHPVEASGGKEQYSIRSVLHLFAHFIFSCWRGKSYIGIWIGDMSSRTLSNCYRFVCFVVVVVTVSCCCCSSLIVDPQLQMNNNNKIT